MAVVTVLSGHTSQDTAYLVADYPYGFRLRCQIRYWIETKPGFGQRVITQTSNPKKPGLVWNKPKASTYSDVCALYLDEQGYVQHSALVCYSSLATIVGFEQAFETALTSERDQKTLRTLKIVAQRLEDREAARKAAVEAVEQAAESVD